jgi:hypothetical protein
LFLGGKRATENLVREHTQPWAVFRLPGNPVPLQGLDASLETGAITICNRSGENWSGILIQIDQGYLAALKQLKAGECKQIPIQEFATESWKRMPPPRDLHVTRVAILAEEPHNGYVEKSLIDGKALSTR